MNKAECVAICGIHNTENWFVKCRTVSHDHSNEWHWIYVVKTKSETWVYYQDGVVV